MLIWAPRVSETHPDAEFRTPHDCISGRENDLPEHLRRIHVWLPIIWSGQEEMSSLADVSRVLTRHCGWTERALFVLVRYNDRCGAYGHRKRERDKIKAQLYGSA